METPPIKIEKVWDYRGFRCVIVGVPWGHRCGYIRIPNNHRLHGESYNHSEFIGNMWVHGGVTFTEEATFDKESGYWIGYDCGHSSDRPDPELVAGEYRGLTSIMTGSIYGTIRTLDFCIQECHNMVDQVVETYGELFQPVKLEDNLFDL